MTQVRRVWIAAAIIGIGLTGSVPRGDSWVRMVAAQSVATQPAGARQAQPVAKRTAATPARGGSLVATLRSEPRSFNPVAVRDFASTLVAMLTHAKLLRINRATQQLDPWLAEKYACTADGLTCTLNLRRGVQFSDGQPFTSADVVFSFAAVYDDKTGSPLADAIQVGGKPIAVAAPDANTIVLTFPSAFGPGLRLLDALPILPKHRLD
ncbi:MAG: ABC transporter substrate-binding protein, partial [Acidobacteria bacterium]|nr:ABC transporter substrate-binding protein [Acidobacteriota bacterium]